MTEIKLSTLRPGLLVSLSTSVRGNVRYQSRTLEADHLTSEGERKARWETLRVVEDPKEHEEAIQVRSKVRSLITGVCSSSAFGLLCPESDKPALDAAIAEARDVAARFNATASRSSVSVYVIAGRIAADDAEAVRAIRSEVEGLIGAMRSGAAALDPKAIRDAANRARDLAGMLTPQAAGRVNEAIEEARAYARKIVREASDAAERAAMTVDAAVLERLDGARLAFLDVDDLAPAPEPIPVAAAALDLAPASEEPPTGWTEATPGPEQAPAPAPVPAARPSLVPAFEV